MSLLENVRKMGTGALALTLAYLLIAFGLIMALSALYGAIEGTLSANEASGTVYAGFGLMLIGNLIGIYGVYAMYSGSKTIEKRIYDLRGLSTGYTLLLISVILGFLAALFNLIAYGSGDLFLYLAALLEFIGLILIGTRTKKLKAIHIDPGSAPTLILVGAILIFFGIGAFLLLIGFLLLGLNLRKVPQYSEDMIMKIKDELAKELEANNAVNLLQFASVKNYPVLAVFEAAYRLAQERNLTIVNGTLTSSFVIQ